MWCHGMGWLDTVWDEKADGWQALRANQDETVFRSCNRISKAFITRSA